MINKFSNIVDGIFTRQNVLINISILFSFFFTLMPLLGCCFDDLVLLLDDCSELCSFLFQKKLIEHSIIENTDKKPTVEMIQNIVSIIYTISSIKSLF